VRKEPLVTMNDHRDNARIKLKADIQFENYLSGSHHKARMYNYSTGGMYFETDYAPLPGTEIYIGIKNSPYDAGADVYRAEIRWRKQLKAPLSNHQFGVGVKYYHPFML
jgi:hypothetical protein